MKTIYYAIGLLLPALCTTIYGQIPIAADSRRGERLFETESCLQCHSIDGKGGKAAPDLGKHVARNFTPALLATVMWNHAPAMWAEMQRRNVTIKPLDEQASADLFAYFYSVRYFEPAADAGRGKHLFTTKHCAECHGASASGTVRVIRPEFLADPLTLAEGMWNHSHNMEQEFAARKVTWPQLTGQDLSDILIYLRTQPSSGGTQLRFDASKAEEGQKLFQAKGCPVCHTGALVLDPLLRGKTPTGIAAEMWNHAPLMTRPAPQMETGEMRSIVSYLWARSVTANNGNQARGKKVFVAKRCSTCHDGASGAPDLSKRKGGFSAITMVSTLWRHGPQMLDQMKAKQIKWPAFHEAQMSDLIAYLNAEQNLHGH